MSNPIQTFDNLLKSSDFLFVVYYRGHWCPFCMSYLKDLQKIVQEIESANGTPLIVTAEDEKFLPDTISKSGYKGKSIVDPENLLVQELRRRELVDVAITPKGGYPHGMAQPAVLVLKSDGTSLVSWAIKPSMMNLGGAKDRAALNEIWEDAQSLLKDEKATARNTFSKRGIWSVLVG